MKLTKGEKKEQRERQKVTCCFKPTIMVISGWGRGRVAIERERERHSSDSYRH